MTQDYDFGDRLADARLIYEQTHGITMNDLSEITGFGKTVLGRQSRAEGWKKTVMSGQTAEAAEAVERFATWRAREEAETAAVAEPLQSTSVVVTDDEKQQSDPPPSASGMATPSAIEQMLQRHAREWAAPRALSAEAVRIRDRDPLKAFERAKLAKITAETLQIVQNGERKALGVDSDPGMGSGSVVVIERESVTDV